MPVVLARTDPQSGWDYYLGEAPDGMGFVREDEPINAAMWEDMTALLAWLDALPPEAIARLEGKPIQAVDVDLDLTGTTFPEGRCNQDKKDSAPRYRLPELVFFDP